MATPLQPTPHMFGLACDEAHANNPRCHGVACFRFFSSAVFTSFTILNAGSCAPASAEELDSLRGIAAMSPPGGWYARGRAMRERRKFKRERRFLRGRIYFNNSRNAVDCLIQDISYEGARIVLSTSADVPHEVQLYIPDRKRLVLAHVRWHHADKLGLAFSEITSRFRLVRPSQHPPHSSLHRAVTRAVLEFSGGHGRRRISRQRPVGPSG
jgi:hypothetical protein